MELSQVATYFDHEEFDAYTASNATWALKAFKGQLKPADFFVTIWNRPTRRRMLTTGPDQEPPTKIFRVRETGDVYLIGTIQRDVMSGKHYRSTMNIHHAMGLAQIIRKYPDGAASNPGWNVEHVVQSTYIDLELRTQKDDAETEYQIYGNFYCFTPGDSPLQDEDYIRYNGKDYWIEVVYEDSGYKVGRAMDKPDQRVNVVYNVLSSESYNDSTGAVTPTASSYNVTMKLFDFVVKEKGDVSPNRVEQKAVIKTANLPNTVTPKIGDTITSGSVTWRVVKTANDSLKNEWALELERT